MPSNFGKSAMPLRMFANSVPGLAPLLAREVNGIEGLSVQDTGFDGRSDVVLFDAHPSTVRSVLDLRLAEDVYAEIGRTFRSEGDRAAWIAGRIWTLTRAQRALATKGLAGRTPGKRATFRVIARVLQERSFLRTDMRREFARAVMRTQPEWRLADPSEVEVWVSEYRQGKVLAGVRLSGAAMRQHNGRTTERSGAMRPTVAAAMVALAGQPKGLVLDPCCGSGTILAEALAVGWDVRGVDIDPEAIRTAKGNVPGSTLEEGDARELALPNESVDAYLFNVPFGRQYTMRGSIESWLTTVLAEAARVTRPGAPVVLVAPTIPRSVVPPAMRLVERHLIRLLGTRTAIWRYERR